MRWGVRKDDRKGLKRGPRLKYDTPQQTIARKKASRLGYSALAIAGVSAISAGMSVAPGPTLAAFTAGMGVFATVKAKANRQLKNTQSVYKDENRSRLTLKDLARKTTSNQTIEEDMRSVNDKAKFGYTPNCSNCIIAYEMRRRGYDVKAAPTPIGRTDDQIMQFFNNAKYSEAKLDRKNGESRKDYVERSYNNLVKTLESQGEGARGYIGFTWDTPEGIPASGHVINYEVTKAGVKFIDCQNNKVNNTAQFAISKQNYTYARFDTLEVNDYVAPNLYNAKEKR